jgi:hypothetical protein
MRFQAGMRSPFLERLPGVSEHERLMNEPREKKLRISSFAVHSARGLVRDRSARRWSMFMAVIIAVVLLFTGSTFLRPVLRAHPIWFILLWFACAWFTLLALLLALFDLLLLRAESREAKRDLARKLSEEKK